jgi:D-alanine-D-alanine ligase-like ATP-grasp enzyme
MRHDAILIAHWRADPSSPSGSDCGSAHLRDRGLASLGFERASEAFEGYGANYGKGGLRHITSDSLKPNIYYKAQDLARGVRGRSGLSRAAFRFTQATGDEDEIVGLEVNAEPGMTEMSPVPVIIVPAGSSFEPHGRAVEDPSCDR